MNYISTAIILIVTLGSFKNTNAEETSIRLIGGLPTKPREIKYLVGIYHNGNYICGGGIIGQAHVLTAAHCVVNKSNQLKKGKLKIVAGSDNLKVKTPSTVEINVNKYYVPSVYNGSLWGKQYPTGDIAVLELKDRLDLTHNATLRKLELSSHNLKLAPRDVATQKLTIEIAGFGKDNFTYFANKKGERQIKWLSSRKLLKGKVQIIDKNVCISKYRDLKPYRGQSILCGTVRNYDDGTRQGICAGDSGSPLVLNGTTVIGVVSSTNKKLCNDNDFPGIYTKITPHYKKFIDNVKQGIIDDMRVHNL